MARILVIPDLHCPFEHPDAFSFLKKLKRLIKPDEFICLGDEIDAHSFSRWVSDPDGYSPGHELDRALISMKKLYEIFPEMKVCTSNHTVRPLKKAIEVGLPRKFFKGYSEFLEAPAGWSWRDRWILDDILFEHGEGVSGAHAHLKAARANMQSTVIGHVHAHAGFQYLSSHEKLIFGFNAGCLINPETYAFDYGKKLRDKPILGAAVILDGVPQFIPMILDRKGKWTRKI